MHWKDCSIFYLRPKKINLNLVLCFTNEQFFLFRVCLVKLGDNWSLYLKLEGGIFFLVFVFDKIIED